MLNLDDVRLLKDRLEAANEDLARIPRHSHNAVKIADRESQIDMIERQVERIEALYRAFQARQAELLARCQEFDGTQH